MENGERTEASPVQSDDPRAFWSAVGDLDEMEFPAEQEKVATLERLVPSPFLRSGFPLIGFLATVYDHVAGFARERGESPAGGMGKRRAPGA